MAGALVTSVLVEPLVSRVKEKASSWLLEQYQVMAGMEDQRDDLNRYLPAILDIITDAEKQGADRRGVKAWLEALKSVAYEAIDVFDEFKYEALRREAKKNGHYIKLGMGVVCLFPVDNPIMFRCKMGKKLCRIVQTIQERVDEMNKFEFSSRRQQQAPTPKPLRELSVPNISEKIVSREKEKKKIVELLLGQADKEDLMVLPVVGMGGLGKTTFAKFVYLDPAIEKHFQLRMWVYVSEDFDIGILARKIIEMATNKVCDLPKDNLPLLLQILKQELSAKRYFLVLDDVWTEDVDKWKTLKSCLQHGGAGSAILTTTRKERVARIMGTVEAHDLEKLGKDALKEIFERRAFSSQEQKLAGLVDLIDKIVEKCAGSPLAAKALGSVLRNKSTIEDWQAILSKSSICNEETGILPILKLSYDDLPTHMKQCFAFCAMFPKDYEIDVETLIQLWMANDFIPLQQDVQMETKGEEIFKELLWRSFFQDVNQVPYIAYGKHGHCGRSACKIHGLMHEVAQSVMGQECATIFMKLLDLRDSLSDSTRHLFLSHVDNSGTHLNDFLKKSSPGIQTLLCCDYINTHLGQLSKYSSLRALKLKEGRPIKTSHWKHLRYLDLSGNYDIVTLPEEISTLYNLQTLNLSDCYELCYLPNGMKYMTALRHLYTIGCSKIKYMPQGLGELTSLQTLTRFPAGTDSNNCSNIRELQSLNLGGRLELYHLQNVTEADARAANLEVKNKLTELLVSWGDLYCDGRPNQVVDQEKKVLEALKPHVGLRVLEVQGCRSTEFSYIDMLEHLVELRLLHCRMCEKLPKLWQLHGLKVLQLCDMGGLKFICSGDDGNTTSSSFPELKELELRLLKSLKGWWEVEGRQREQQIFPELVSLRIDLCPELATLPEAPKLEELDVTVEQSQMCLSITTYMTSLSTLNLTVKGDYTSLPLEKYIITMNQNHGASTLSKMVLSGCDFLFPSNPSQPALGLFWRYFGVLQILEIESSDALVYWPEEEFQSLSSLKRLDISYCHQLTGCARGTRPSASERNQLLPCLQSLNILFCSSLVEIFYLPSCLREISIFECRKLETVWEKQDPRQSLQVESLTIYKCGSVGKLLDLPRSLRYLYIRGCSKLELLSGQLDALETLDIDFCGSLKLVESCLGDLRSLKFLSLKRCKSLTSLPNEAGEAEGYSSLQRLIISYCPALKPLPISLQQRLDTLPSKFLSHAFSREPNEVSCSKVMNPKSWKYAIRRN